LSWWDELIEAPQQERGVVAVRLELFTPSPIALAELEELTLGEPLDELEGGERPLRGAKKSAEGLDEGACLSKKLKAPPVWFEPKLTELELMGVALRGASPSAEEGSVDAGSLLITERGVIAHLSHLLWLRREEPLKGLWV
jgi:hypothetical protein